METPKLWCTIVVDTSLWDDCAPASHPPISARGFIERWRKSPFVRASLLLGIQFPSALCSTAQLTAPRWQDVFLASDADPSDYPTGAKRKLGRLEKLQLPIAGSWKRMDIFREAPRLTEITLRGEIDNVPDLPWVQILTFSAPAADCSSLLTGDDPEHDQNLAKT